MGHFPPMARSAMGYAFEVPGREELRIADGPLVNWVAPGYFATTGTRIVRGRDIADTDRTGDPVALINESLARILAPGGDPVGTCISVAEQTRTKACTRIVGVVENQRRTFLEEKVTPFVFLARDRDPDALSWGGPTLVVRTRGDAGVMAGEVRSTLQSMDPRLPFVAVESLASVIRPDILPYRLGASLFGLFGALALILAGVGLYGSLGYFVAERRPEIGIRRSLGAEERHVVTLVLREGMLPVLGGLVVGLAAAAAGVRLVESLLFGVPARDAASFGAAAFFLTAVAAAASYLPARRAARVEPMVALRAQ